MDLSAGGLTPRTGELQESLTRSGYAVIPQLLRREEVFALRGECESYFRAQLHLRSYLGRNLPSAVQFLPQLHWLYSDPRVIACFRAALGTEDIVFTRHCDIAQNRLSVWHKDSNGYFDGDLFNDPTCRVYKMALYLQDHADAGGFSVREGSHVESRLDVGAPRHLCTRVGDAVLFDVRLTHSGQFPSPVERMLLALSRMLNPRGKNTPEWAVRAKDAYWKLRGVPDRFSVFFSMGLRNRHTQTFCERNMARQKQQLKSVRMDGGDLTALAARLSGQGVGVFDG